jgi:hypothetical protein
MMLIRTRIVWALLALPVVVSASQAPGPVPLKPGDFVTFILADSGPNPEPRDPNVRLGVGGSAVEQPTDVLVYSQGETKASAGSENVPGMCAPGTIQTGELVDPEGKRPNRTISVITTHPNMAIPPMTRLEELQLFSKCVDATDKLFIEYIGTLRALPGEVASGN